MSGGFDIVPLANDLKPFANSEYSGIPQHSVVPTASDAAQTDFATTLKEAGTKMVQTIENAEAVSIAGLKGEADTYEVVSSIMQAEQSLRMAVSVRDKIISAYLEISRMQI